jgi:hypothetical protein
MANKTKMPWKEPDNDDDWDSIATALFESAEPARLKRQVNGVVLIRCRNSIRGLMITPRTAS